MNRLLSILVTLFILFLVYLWINHLTSGTSDKQETRSETPEVIAPIDEELEDDTAIVQTPIPAQELSAEEDQPGSGTGDAGVQSAPVEKKVETQEEKPTPPKPSEPSKPAQPVKKSTPTPAPQTKPVAGNPDAASQHLVIAGNFLTRGNAEERVKQLQKLGYTQAEVVNFELSEYHTACAGRYTNLNEARKVSKKIKEMHGIDTYVRLGN